MQQTRVEQYFLIFTAMYRVVLFMEYSYTVMLIEMPRFSVAKLLLHHYKSDLAHTSHRYSSVINLYLS